MEGLWLNHCLLSLLSEAPQDNLPGCSLTHNTLSPPTLAVNQENAPTDMPSGQSEGDSSTEIASSQRTLAYVKLTKPTSLSGWLISAWFSSLASSCIVPGPCCFISRRISQREDESYITGPTSPWEHSCMMKWLHPTVGTIILWESTRCSCPAITDTFFGPPWRTMMINQTASWSRLLSYADLLPQP